MQVTKMAKGEVLMLNIGSMCTGACVIAVKHDLAKLQLTSPVCTKVRKESIALTLCSAVTSPIIAPLRTPGWRICIQPCCPSPHRRPPPHTLPPPPQEGEKVALSRRVEKHWRLIGWGQIQKGLKMELAPRS